ncbi:hypothetical protein NIES4103_09920 [Nostoc sp. NIES-4103]|nr:hypothetical protein NIES4103_09920 [Nostoc sp. NIES-4103]
MFIERSPKLFMTSSKRAHLLLRIPACQGVVAFGLTLRECEDELRSTLEDWILLGLKLEHELPVIKI